MRIIIHHSRKIIPAPADDVEIAEIGLPQLIDPLSWLIEFVLCRQHDIRRTGDEIIRLQDAVDA